MISFSHSFSMRCVNGLLSLPLLVSFPLLISCTGLLEIKNYEEASQESAKNRVMPKQVEHCTILCAKEVIEQGYSPKYEWFLLGEPGTNNLYVTRDFSRCKLLAPFVKDIQQFCFAILPNDDVIAVKKAEYLNKGGTDANRENPYLIKTKDNCCTIQELDFGDELKPCGWLENCGFRSLPDGSSLLCEYTRVNVATSNVWKIEGDVSNTENWAVTKSFRLSGLPDAGFKHCHAVMYDHYAGVTYLSTGDDNTSAMVFSSQDGGLTWSQLREPSELMCRMLMMTFTIDYIYWAQDSPGRHFFYRGRRTNGVLDYDTVETLSIIPGDKDHYFASYGQCYLPEHNAVLLLDRQDSATPGQIMPIRVINLSDGTIETISEISGTDDEGGNIGFRTLFSEWYPTNGIVRLGFGFGSPTINKNNVCGNKWPIDNGLASVNNLILIVQKNDGRWSLSFDTYNPMAY